MLDRISSRLNVLENNNKITYNEILQVGLRIIRLLGMKVDLTNNFPQHIISSTLNCRHFLLSIEEKLRNACKS